MEWGSNNLHLSLFLSAMEFHEHLHSIGTKEGLKERKLQKAVESFTWNITILKVLCLLLFCCYGKILQPRQLIEFIFLTIQRGESLKAGMLRSKQVWPEWSLGAHILSHKYETEQSGSGTRL